MKRSHRALLATALLASIAVPVAAAQMGPADSYNFLKAVRARDASDAETALVGSNFRVINARDPNSGETALHILARGRDFTWLSYLLRRGARPNEQSNDGSTPLGLVASIGWIEGAEQLIARGADVNLANNRGETPLILAVHGRNAPMVELLVQRGADPNRTDSIAGYSALDYARRDSRNPEMVRLLEAAPQQEAPEVYGPSPN